MYGGISNLLLSDGRTLNWKSSPAACSMASKLTIAVVARSSSTHHVPLDMTVERPKAGVVRDEAEDDVGVRGNDERIPPVASGA